MNFRDYFDWTLVDQIGVRISKIDSEFDKDHFREIISKDLLRMSMKDRIHEISIGLYSSIGKPYASSVDLLLKAMDVTSEAFGVMRGFPVWVIANVIEMYGLDHPWVSLQAIHKITQHFTGEFAIRPYLEHYPEQTLRTLREWAVDSSPDVRRLVSEGLRPRLPWASRVSWLMEDPSIIISLLDELRADSSEYVRRSVANNLNDISKSYPDEVVSCLTRWQIEDGESKNLDALVRHACRGMVKRAHEGALQLQGFSAVPELSVDIFDVCADELVVGGKFTVNLKFMVASGAEHALIIDLVLLSPGAKSEPRKRVLKWCRRKAKGNDSISISKSWSLEGTTARVERAGVHSLELLINGSSFGEIDFNVAPAVASLECG